MSTTAKTRGEIVADEIDANAEKYTQGWPLKRDVVQEIADRIDAERADAAKEEREAITDMVKHEFSTRRYFSPVVDETVKTILNAIRARGEQ